MANNKVQLADGTTLIDLTEDTVTAGDLISGVTAHDRSGKIITGTFDPSIYIENSEKGAANGVAELDSSGKVPISQLPQIVPLMISQQPVNASFSEAGDQVTFSLTAAGGSGTYTYQWQILVESGWINLAGSTRSYLTMAANRTVALRCIVSDGTDTIYSDIAYAYHSGATQYYSEYAVNAGNYGVCSTAAETQIKEVEIPGLVVVTGVTIHVSFANANTASSPKLSVNGSTAKYMVQYGSIAIGTTASTNGWQAGAVVSFTYNGTYWVRDQGYNTNSTYSNVSLGNGIGSCTPVSGSTDLTVTLSGYTLATGGRVTILFSGDMPADATLNINDKGAKAITAKGANGVAAITEGVIKNGDTATFIYDGIYYQLLSIDRVDLIDVPALEQAVSTLNNVSTLEYVVVS
jgi:hypothetical protein